MRTRKARITRDKSYLRRVCEPVRTKKEASEIAQQLISTLRQYKRVGWKKTCVGLSANQIGIFKQVCVLLFKDVPLVLVNPRMVPVSEVKIPYKESCLSLPGQTVETYRWPRVIVTVDNLPGEMKFGPQTPEQWSKSEFLKKSILLQHHLGHLAGKVLQAFSTTDYPDDPSLWLIWRPSWTGENF